MDLVSILYGAIAGAVGGVLWGRFHRPRPARASRSVWESLAGFAVFAITVALLDAFKSQLPQLPTQFWLTALVVGWFVEPLGERLRR